MSEFTARPDGLFGELGPGSRVAGYVIEEQIGAGGMAVVFRARDEMLGRLAAVKVIAPPMAGDPEFRARFLRESRAVAAIDSPHIIPVYAAGEADGTLYIATRFAAGGDLAALARRAGGFLAPERAAALVAQVASALDAAHAAGLVHRDVKPHNILIDSTPDQPEHAFLSDFGLTRGTGSSTTELTAAGQFVGTPEYCAPEQIRATSVDGRADQYALGCVAFALLTGQTPFHRGEAVATLYAHVNDPVPSLCMIRPELPPAIDRVIARALAKAPADRYARCGEFAAALQSALTPGDAPEIARTQLDLPRHPSSSVSPAFTTQSGLAAPREGGGYASTIGGGDDNAGSLQSPLTSERASQPKRLNRRPALIGGTVAVILAAAVLTYAERPTGPSHYVSTSQTHSTSSTDVMPTASANGSSGVMPTASAGGSPGSASHSPGNPSHSPGSVSHSPGSASHSPGSASHSPSSASHPSSPSPLRTSPSPTTTGTRNVVPSQPPGQVTGVTATRGDRRVVLNWQAAPGKPTGYQVKVSPAPTGGSGLQQLGTATSDTVTGLTNGTTYTFTVAAANAAGNGPSSPAVTAVPAGQPVAISAPVVTDTGSFGTSSIIEASSGSFSGNGLPPLYFTVYEYEASSSSGPFGGTPIAAKTQSPHGGNGTLPRFTVSNDGSWYEYAFTLTTAAGTSALSPLSPAIQVPVASTTSSPTAAA